MNLAVTAIGRDRPGTVAGITSVLLEMDGNVDDSQMSILDGQFAVMLIVSVPDATSTDELSARLDEAGREFGLA
ncbi:MAG: ACT domain-containing protein [Solirubrobacterales bacterium]